MQIHHLTPLITHIETELRRRVEVWGKLDKKDKQAYLHRLQRYFALESALIYIKGMDNKRNISRCDIASEVLQLAGERQKVLLRVTKREQLALRTEIELYRKLAKELLT